MNGHWYCTFCEDVKFFPAPAVSDNDSGYCPDCRNNALRWVPHVEPRRRPRCVTAEEAKQKFQAMRDNLNLENPS